MAETTGHLAENDESSYGHVLKYISIFGGVQGLNILIGLVRNKIVAYLLGPEGMGLVSLFNSTINFISQATNLGVSFSAIRHVSELFDSGDEARIQHFVKVIRLWSALTAVLGMLVCVVAGPWLSDYTFSWGNHTLHFVMLAPAVGLLAITGGETAILKGCRKLKALAMIQVYNIFISLILSVPIYYFFNQTGIVPVIVLMALASMFTTIYYSYRFYPLALHGYAGLLGEGGEIIRLGIAFVLAGVLGSGAEILIRSYLNVVGELDVVGFYNAGFMLSMTYAGMVFSAMETDYFPRLSAVVGNVDKISETVNRQIEVTLLLVSPMLTALIIGMPVVIPLLFTSEFIPIVGMSQVVLLSMYLRAVYLPIAYITLAKGDSIPYLVLEGIYNVLLVLLVIVGYTLWGLYGTGIALAIANASDIIIVFYALARYHYRMSASVVSFLLINLLFGFMAYGLTFIDNPYVYWPLGILVSLVSLTFSLVVLHRKVSLWNALWGKIRNRFKPSKSYE